jgi:hypothetical protein
MIYMAMTFEEIRERLKRLDEVLLLEVLNISSEDIVERFADIIEDKLDVLEPELEEISDEESDS